ncbi:DUF6348 family protein [Frateuria terrea]|uniref:Uncharacterized protein n=1 Tax=Frateuria terrea TaxID=529704 RepID=A0A1H6VV57_9GAMM|nr:DUF6348 family protein [Frateuria terrea]SEJ03925.1 hypothetical protein SAMN04487997_2291 [Frateuria terrea]SFP63661.1 hypothetical protein SAMN02927913_2939 [Frateuria terrea]
MSPTDLQTRLLRLFERHEVELEPDEDWLLTDGDFPAVRASWQDGTAGGPGRLDVDVVLDEERQLELSYAGSGADPCRDALDRFARGDLPVLLAACWYVTDDRRLDLAQWEIGLRQWDAFIGRFVVEGADVNVPPAALPAVAEALKNESLSPRMHWIRLFLRREVDGSLASELLLDNQPWPAGDRALAGLAWPEGGQAYSVRSLIVLDMRDY